MQRTVYDMLGRQVEIEIPLQRIISIVPSQTELLFDLGLESEVAGITKFCVHPPDWFKNKTRVGGTKTLNIEKIRQLNPDLILANKEENEKEQIELLAKDFPVWVSDIATLEQALEMIVKVGSLVEKEPQADLLKQTIARSFQQIQKPQIAPRVVYLIWYKPWMAAGGDTFIGDMIRQMGWRNVLEDHPRYPVVSIEELATLAPDILLLSSEPFPFRPKHAAELLLALPKASVKMVDGELFSWYGSRLQHTSAYLHSLQSGQ